MYDETVKLIWEKAVVFSAVFMLSRPVCSILINILAVIDRWALLFKASEQEVALSKQGGNDYNLFIFLIDLTTINLFCTVCD